MSTVREEGRQSITENTTAAVRRMILDGELRDGSPIHQEDLAAELGVSRIPVREALRQLATEGLVKLNPYRSAEVSALSMEELIERIELRLWIEPKLIRIAIERITDAQIAKVASILREYDSGEKPNWRSWADINCRFHVAMYEPSGRGLAVAFSERLLKETGRYRTRMLRRSGLAKACEEHAALLEQFRRRDPNRGASLLRQHILRWKTLCLTARSY